MTDIFTADGASAKIILNPATVAEEVLQNLRMILATPKYSVPLDRAFGISWEMVDRPMEAAQSFLVGEIMDVVERYEPRAEIVNITFTRDEMAARLTPKLEVRIIER